MNKFSETQTLIPLDAEGIGKTSVRREIGLRNAVALTVGSMIGSGIFVSPKGVLREAGSVGMALVVWTACGVFCMIGALCYVELGLIFQKSGSDFVYIRAIFGEMLSFLFIWVQIAVLPASKAVNSLVFANYLLEPTFQGCSPPGNATRLIAASLIGFLTYINCKDVKWMTRVQDVFTLTKITSLVIIILTGFYQIMIGKTQNFENAFHGTATEPGHIALSLYSGLFSYSGWNALNFVIEEVKNPPKNLSRAIYISLPLVSMIYILSNVAYFAVLTSEEIVSSNAVAVTFGERVLGVMSWVMPVSVALSTFGGLNGSIFTTSRMFFVGAREGHLPSCLSMINVNTLTPIPSIVFLCLLCILYLSTTEIYVLINYLSFVDAVFCAISVAGLIWVNIVLVFIYLLTSVFLVTVPIYVRPWETGMGIAITVLGIPIYMATVSWREKPKIYQRFIRKLTEFAQKLFLSVSEEMYE